jgi:phosphoserine phosphatase RsbU/P
MLDNDDDEILFADDSEDALVFADDNNATNEDFLVEKNNLNISNIRIDRDAKTWKVLLVDDEEEIHIVTKFALGDYKYKGRTLQFFNAYNGNQAIQILKDNTDIAIILLDVVMETNDAGLKVVESIRQELKNEFVRIIMRTGQPGQAPEEDIILKYDINDYKNKTELTDKKLFTTITTSLRSYNDIMEIEHYRQNLEKIVDERTSEIIKQKKELEAINKDITDSINYAFRIQTAMLPDLKKVIQHIPENFIFFKPKDIVSGDFYWFTTRENKVIISAVDCTGHGVPGAFMSMVGDALLNQIVNIERITSPELILQRLHIKIRQALKQETGTTRDGMDIALCVIDLPNKILEYAGAKNPLIYVQNNELHEIRADRHSIGGEQLEKERVFAKHTISIDTPTWIYLFSDGFPDQFGGERRKKFMTKNLKNLLFEHHQKPFSQQKEILEETFENWKNTAHENQLDDVLVIGCKIN